MTRFFSTLLITIASILSVQTAMAKSNDITYFYTIPEAEQHCPINTALTFKPNNPVPNSAGSIFGMFNGTTFLSTTNSMIQPQNLDTNNVITDAQFRATSAGSAPYYGYISGNQTTCLYSYTAFTGVSVALILQNV